jgi:hypothetical protein
MPYCGVSDLKKNEDKVRGSVEAVKCKNFFCR